MKLVQYVVDSMSLSRAAIEEASRFGQQRADVEHVLLAVVLSEQSAGQLLRNRGVTVARARQAVADLHADRLASLGLDVALPEHGIDPRPGGDLAPRAAALFGVAPGGSTATQVLLALLDEPSGTVGDVLARLDVDPDEVRAEVQRLARHAPGIDEAPVPADQLTGMAEGFVPASPDQVWALLVDPARLPEWEPGVGALEASPSDRSDPAREPQPGDTWTYAPLASTGRAPGGQRLELLERRDGELLAWRFSLPALSGANQRVVQVGLAPAAGGTQVTVYQAWVPGPDPNRGALATIVGPFLRVLLRPLHRVVLALQARRLARGIALVFR